jgi:hypothetical protein
MTLLELILKNPDSALSALSATSIAITFWFLDQYQHERDLDLNRWADDGGR